MLRSWRGKRTSEIERSVTNIRRGNEKSSARGPGVRGESALRMEKVEPYTLHCTTTMTSLHDPRSWRSATAPSMLTSVQDLRISVPGLIGDESHPVSGNQGHPRQQQTSFGMPFPPIQSTVTITPPQSKLSRKR